MLNRKVALTAALLSLGAVAAGSAHAGDVHWSIGINLPAVGTVISNAPVYHAPRPVYVEPAPVVVYRPVPQVVYRPGPVVVHRPVPVYAPRYYYGPGVTNAAWVGPSHHWRYRHDRREDRRDDRRDNRGGAKGGDRWSPAPDRQHH